MSRKVGIYARVSKVEAERNESSVPVQLAECQQRARQEGWSVVDQYTDEGISAWKRKAKRPEFERLIADVAAGRIDTILIREQERLLRQLSDTSRVQELARDGRLKLIASTMESDINFARARDRDDFRKRSSQAEFYSDFLSEKIRATKARQRAAGTYTGGGRSFGYRFAENGLAVEPKEAAHIHDAVKRLARHESLYRITLDWNAAGIRTAGGGRWRPANLRRMLTSEHLTGGNGYPAILKDVEAAIVRQELGEQPTVKRGRPPGRRYAASSLLFCGECGSKLTTGTGAYRCSVSHGGCGKVSVKATDLERYLLEVWVQHALKRPRKKTKTPRSKSLPDAAPLLAELRDVELRLEEVASGLAEGTLTVGVAGAANQKLEQRRKALTEQLARTLPEPQFDPTVRVSVARAEDGKPYIVSAIPRLGPDGADDLVARWETRRLTDAENEQLRELLAYDIERVTIAPRDKRGPAFEPKRVRIAWR